MADLLASEGRKYSAGTSNPRWIDIEFAVKLYLLHPHRHWAGFSSGFTRTRHPRKNICILVVVLHVILHRTRNSADVCTGDIFGFYAYSCEKRFFRRTLAAEPVIVLSNWPMAQIAAGRQKRHQNGAAAVQVGLDATKKKKSYM